MSTSSNIASKLAAQGYTARRAETLALTALEQQPDGARILLLEGPPGAGKTHLAACYAAATGARHVYALLHAWTDDQELFAGVDVVAAVAGDAARVHRPGVLALAAEASQAGATVVCLDEIDKAPERVEALLLDVLQTGRVPVRPGVHLEARLDSLIVCLTSNGTRPLRGDARAVAGALRQLLRTLDICGDDPSPRLDARGLVTELVTRRYALARAQRRELAPAVVVLAADCSGSCSAVCDATLTACLAIAREMPHVLVVRHSNGEVIDASGVLAARLQPRVACRLGEIPALLGCPVAGTVAFGAWDAGHCYERLAASGAPLYWLDSYAARAGEPRPASARLRAGSETWRHKPAGWYQGVNDAARAAYALREMAREVAR